MAKGSGGAGRAGRSRAAAGGGAEAAGGGTVAERTSAAVAGLGVGDRVELADFRDRMGITSDAEWQAVGRQLRQMQLDGDVVLVSRDLGSLFQTPSARQRAAAIDVAGDTATIVYRTR